MASRSQSGDADRTKLASGEGRPLNKKQDASGSTPTNEDEVQRTINPRPSTLWPPPRPQRDDIQAYIRIPTEEIQPRAPESQEVYLDDFRGQANSLSARFRGSTQEVGGVIGRSIERVGDWIYRYEILPVLRCC